VRFTASARRSAYRSRPPLPTIRAQNPDGKLEPGRGIRQLVVGAGGKSPDGFGRVEANSEVRNADRISVLQLTLHPGSYDWRFVLERGGAFTDGGSGSCH
jgi:hypothetical protein